jgi:hypothetical protein
MVNQLSDKQTHEYILKKVAKDGSDSDGINSVQIERSWHVKHAFERVSGGKRSAVLLNSGYSTKK